MRDDMARVIVERPRRGGWSFRKGRQVALDDLPQKQGLRRFQCEHGGDKYLNENLAPLRRFLEKQVGRPWDKVYGEISARLRPTNVVQQHVRDHLDDFVAVKPRRDIASIYRWRRNGLWHQPLYVDPRDGILKRTDRLPEEKARRRQEAARKLAPPVERITLAADRELRCLDGIWYEITLAPLPEPRYAAGPKGRTLAIRPVRDVVSGVTVPVGPEIDGAAAWQTYRQRHPDRRYAVAKRQLAAPELCRHGIANRV
ncbi:hypothetical protein [Vineibacter terrae]|uniref:hypothetical protein n=1 Tax=Vineibacter terrae TaxID=2586908 RepID=UPI002E2FC324|nr:hypothetical protein [Vineibacter terrae]HEX2886367.1 hypothetical protein [Vineibacter terrae]